MHFHQIIHQFLINYRNQQDETFNFMVRQRASTKDKNFIGGKFAHGLVFQGNNDYCFVGLVNRSGGANATRSVGLVFKPVTNGYSLNFDIVFPGEKNQDLIKFYKSLASKFDDVKWDPKGTRAYKTIGEFNENQPDLIYDWLNKNYPIIQKTALESGIEDLIPDSKKFNELQRNLNEKLKQARGSLNSTSTVKPKEKLSNQVTAFFNKSLNQIFYGPPGTGKTYNTILEAAKIIKQNEDLSYDEAQTIFNENLRGQIEFITFHQNYSYEDFIQGLRPDIEQKALSFNRADGIFTKMVTNALFEYYKVYQKNQKTIVSEEDSKIDLNDAYIEFVNSLKEDDEFETKTGAKIKVDNFTDKQNIEFKPINGVKSYLVSGNRLLKLYSVFDDINKIKRVHEDIVDAIGGCNATIYYVALREFIEFLKVYKATASEFEDDAIDYDNITYRRKKELLSSVNSDDLRTVSEHAVPKYVIIIDEINRANISRVFGELITLIEKDKRSHGKIPLSATLPSGEKFIVPSNLHIIGTMNTADKSIALLDIALRRRFEFVPMYPDSNSTEDKIVNDATILDDINKEVISRKGHDFTIGHSYFMGEDYILKNTIDNKVIPLLLEYFMNDFEEVKKILGAANIKVDGWPMQYVAND